MEKILITGGTGFIGSNIVKKLVDQGYIVRVLDNNSRGNLEKLDGYIDRIEWIRGDVRNYEDVRKSAEGMDALFHLAYINGTRYFYEMPEKVLEVAVKGAINTLDAVIEHKIKKYILASSSEVYHQPTKIPTPETERVTIPDILNPRFSYAGGKIISELLAIHYALRYGFKTLIFRPHNVFGPNMGYEHVIPELFIKMKKASNNFQVSSIEIPIQGSGTETRAFCYIDDFVEGLLLCYEMGKWNEIYHIGNNQENVSILDLVHRMAAYLNLDITIKHEALKEGGTLKRCPDISKLRDLGFEPKISLDEGLKRTLDWYRNR